MASFRESEYGWRAEVYRRGVRRSESGFKTKAAAVAWAGKVESEIMSGVRGEIPNLTLAELFDRYGREVSKGKKGERWEVIRLSTFKRDRIALVRLRHLDSPQAADWQQRRLEAVKSATVRRERNLMNNVFEIARKEWKWITKNPFEGVRRPKDGKPRDRVASAAEQRKLLKGASPELGRVITIALETAMRCKEIASNPPIAGRIAKLGDSKTGEGRDVPLSRKALKTWREPIRLTADSISVLFARLCGREGIAGLTFHDLKHTAMTMLSKKLDPWELAKMTGNKDMNLLLRVYYKMDPEDVARKL